MSAALLIFPVLNTPLYFFSEIKSGFVSQLDNRKHDVRWKFTAVIYSLICDDGLGILSELMSRIWIPVVFGK